jgi:putative SOS response-associated peptidase YedK
MCGRTKLTVAFEDLRELYQLSQREPPADFGPKYNLAPSELQAVVRQGERGGRRLDLLRWGLIPWWAKDPKIAHRLINARSEDVATKPAFRDAFKSRRCLVVVDGFYEWKSTDGSRRPFLIRMPDGAPFALAGLWERWANEDGEVVETCAILTQASRGTISELHDRMPVVLPEADFPAWLDPKIHDVEALAQAIASTTEVDRLVVQEVNKRVNSPKNDDPSVLDPPEPETSPRLPGT